MGATHPQELAMVREAFPSLFLLVPGYGAQGGGGREVAPAFVQGNGAVVNASRSILVRTGGDRMESGATLSTRAKRC